MASASNTSHQDESRKTVGVTAHGVAWLRCLEGLRCQQPWFVDKFAEILAGEDGKNWIVEEPRRMGYFPTVVTRTKVIDERMACVLQNSIEIEGINEQSRTIKQICVLGAGLDTRAWRLQAEGINIDDVQYFEVDFPEIFDYKIPLLQRHDAHPKFQCYNAVGADLSLPTWTAELIASGFDPSQPTFWLLEGLTGYLTQEELDLLFQTITDRLAAPGSILVATFITPALKSFRLALHRSVTENPVEYLQGFGWEGSMLDIGLHARTFNRPDFSDDSTQPGYMLVTVQRV